MESYANLCWGAQRPGEDIVQELVADVVIPVQQTLGIAQLGLDDVCNRK